MSRQFRCSQGHSWEARADDTSAEGDTIAVCPVCGESANRLAKTVVREHQTGPYLPEFPRVPIDAPTIPGYEIEGVLGRGGMGVVYRAVQIALKRPVALKMIRGAQIDQQQQDRFRSEAEAVARLQHPNVVQIYEIGECEGRPFFSLEFVAGGTLSDRLATNPLPPPEAAALVETLARAIHAAHGLGVVHRDLKPANVLLTESGTPKVTDFGLAKRLDQDSGQTKAGDVMGTPSYMAPEQADGKLGAVGPAADVYALGAILYEALTGRPPFKGASVLETLDQVRSQEPVSPSALQPKVPRDLETVCLKCLRKEAPARYATAEALADDLRRFLNNEPVLARPVSALQRAAKWVRRRPVIAGLSGFAAVAAVGLLALGGALWYNAERRAETVRDLDSARGERDTVVQEREVARSDRDRAVQERVSIVGDLAEKRRLLDAAERTAGDLGYIADIRRAWLNWQGDKLGSVREALAQRVPAPGQPDRRGFEWWYLFRLAAGASEQRFRFPDTVAVVGIAYSADGQSIAALADGGTVRQFHATTGAILRKWSAPEKPTPPVPIEPRVAFAGARLVILTPAGELYLWDQGEPARVPFRDPVTGFAVSADAATLAIVVARREIRFLDPNTGKEKAKPFAPPVNPNDSFVNAPVFRRDGKALAVSRSGGFVTVLDLTTGESRSFLGRGLQVANALAFAPDGRTIALGLSQKGDVALLDAESGAVRQTMFGHAQPVRCLAYAPDGRTIASGSDDGTVRLWEAGSVAPLAVLKGHQLAVRAVAFAPNGSRLASAGQDGEIRVWNPAVGGESELLPIGPTYIVHRVAFSARGSLVTAGSGDWAPDRPELKTWDTSARRLLTTIHGPGTEISAVAASADGKTLVSCHNQPIAPGSPGEIRLWDLESGKTRATLRGHESAVFCCALSADGRTLATGGGSPEAASAGEVRVWDVATGRPVGALLGLPGVVSVVAFRPDGKELAIGLSRLAPAGGEVRLWDLSSDATKPAWSAKGIMPLSAAYAPDGQRMFVATGSVLEQLKPGQVQVLDLPKNAVLKALDGPKGLINAVALSPDGATLAGAAFDGSVTLWSVTDLAQKRVLRVRPAGEFCFSVAFSRDGKRVLAASSPLDFDTPEGKLTAWDAESGERVAELPQSGVAVLATLPNGEVVGGALSGSLVQWDLAAKKVRQTLESGSPDRAKSKTAALMALAVSPDGETIAVGDRDGEVTFWTLDGKPARSPLPRQPAAVTALGFSPNGKSLAVGTGGTELTRKPGDVTVWNLETNERGLLLLKAPAGVRAVCFAPDGKKLAIGTNAILDPNRKGSRYGEAVLVDPVTATVTDRLPGIDVADAVRVVFTPNGETLLVADGVGRVCFWDLKAGTARAVQGHSTHITGLSLSPDGRTAATGGRDGVIRLWHVATGQELMTLNTPEGSVLDVCFAPDGFSFVSAHQTRVGSVLRVWSRGATKKD